MGTSWALCLDQKKIPTVAFQSNIAPQKGCFKVWSRIIFHCFFFWISSVGVLQSSMFDTHLTYWREFSRMLSDYCQALLPLKRLVQTFASLTDQILQNLYKSTDIIIRVGVGLITAVRCFFLIYSSDRSPVSTLVAREPLDLSEVRSTSPICRVRSESGPGNCTSWRQGELVKNSSRTRLSKVPRQWVSHRNK